MSTHRGPAAAAVLLALVLGACSETPEVQQPHDRQSSPNPADPAPRDAGVMDAPQGYGARLTITEGRGNLLIVRTLGSSSCPFEVDSVQVAGEVIEVVDLPDRSRDLPCTADRARSSVDYVVPAGEVESFRAARSVIVTEDVGQRLRVDLNFALE